MARAVTDQQHLLYHQQQQQQQQQRLRDSNGNHHPRHVVVATAVGIAAGMTPLQPQPQRSSSGCSVRWMALLLVMSNLLMFQMGYLSQYHNNIIPFTPGQIHRNFQPNNNNNNNDNNDYPYTKHDYYDYNVQQNPLAIPRGTVPALPSIRIHKQQDASVGAAMEVDIFNNNNYYNESSSRNSSVNATITAITASTKDVKGRNVKRKFYGGVGDQIHLGGFTDFDMGGISPATWKYMVSQLGIRSIIDVGCGRGISTTWFLTHGLDALCVEGSHDARQRTMLPDPATQMIEHDYTRGPWWPSAQTYDAVWCVEFLEHVGRNHHPNYIATFRKAALLFVTHSLWGGWHHVEVHKSDWWKMKFQSYGFHYSHELTTQIRHVAARERREHKTLAPNGKPYMATHIFLNMQVFINPMVAALPEHGHLFAEPGCFDAYGTASDGKVDPFNPKLRDCGSKPNETPLSPQFKPLPLTPQMDQAWEDIVQKNINTTWKLI